MSVNAGVHGCLWGGVDVRLGDETGQPSSRVLYAVFEERFIFFKVNARGLWMRQLEKMVGLH